MDLDISKQETKVNNKAYNTMHYSLWLKRIVFLMIGVLLLAIMAFIYIYIKTKIGTPKDYLEEKGEVEIDNKYNNFNSKVNNFTIEFGILKDIDTLERKIKIEIEDKEVMEVKEENLYLFNRVYNNINSYIESEISLDHIIESSKAIVMIESDNEGRVNNKENLFIKVIVLNGEYNKDATIEEILNLNLLEENYELEKTYDEEFDQSKYNYEGS
jgi:hypothetical protein